MPWADVFTEGDIYTVWLAGEDTGRKLSVTTATDEYVEGVVVHTSIQSDGGTIYERSGRQQYLAVSQIAQVEPVDMTGNTELIDAESERDNDDA